MFLRLYNAVLLSLLPLFPAVKFLTRKRGNVTLLPRFSTSFPEGEGKILLHVSSVGEATSVKPLVTALKSKTAITAFTDYGLERVRHLYPDIPSRLLPIDIYPVVKSFLKKTRPQKILIYETEIWPSLLKAAKEQNIPVYFVSGKISDRSFKNYKRLRKFLKSLVDKTVFLARTKKDAERAKEIGFGKIFTVGDLKLDVSKPEKLAELHIEGKRTVLIWGSTHPGEEELAFKVHRELKKRFSSILTVVAPRHIGRAKELVPPGKTAFRSKTRKVSKNVDFYVVDTIGELASLYRYADVCIIGGSFVLGIGGHNPVEAVLWKKPVIMGNFCDDFRDVAELLKIPTVEKRELVKLLTDLISKKRIYNKFCENTFKSYLEQRGVTERILKAIGERN
jgi:3-deoxy-D-manno-octulosonic-acid transferase